MIYNWYQIFNRLEFEATGLTSKTYLKTLEVIGQKEILVTKGNVLGMTYEGVYLSNELFGSNPFKFETFAMFEDTATGDVYLGVTP